MTTFVLTNGSTFIWEYTMILTSFNYGQKDKKIVFFPEQSRCYSSEKLRFAKQKKRCVENYDFFKNKARATMQRVRVPYSVCLAG
jgi:hypothetical protein